MRNLRFVETEERVVAFNKYRMGKEIPVKRLLTKAEVVRAKEVIATQDEYTIDAFCYSIA